MAHTCGGGDSLNRNRERVVLTPLFSRGQHQWRVPQTLTLRTLAVTPNESTSVFTPAVTIDNSAV